MESPPWSDVVPTCVDPFEVPGEDGELVTIYASVTREMVGEEQMWWCEVAYVEIPRLSR